MGKLSGKYEIKEIDWFKRGEALRELDKIKHPYIKSFPVAECKAKHRQEEIDQARHRARDFIDHMQPVKCWVTTVGCKMLPSEYLVSIDDRTPPEVLWARLSEWQKPKKVRADKPELTPLEVAIAKTT